MATVKNLLNTKGNDVWTVPITATVKETLKLLADKNIGAVLVLEDKKIAGIFSERDYARHAAQEESMLLDVLVSGLMTRSIIMSAPSKLWTNVWP